MATALLAEHFRYTPLVRSLKHHYTDITTNRHCQTLLDDIINTVNELVFRAVNAIEEGLSNTPPERLGFKPDSTIASEEAQRDAVQDAKQTEVDNGIVQLESLLNATIDRDFDKFEIFTLRNILAVGHEEEDLANWVQLEHYRNLELSMTENMPTPEQVQLQRRKLQENAKLNAMLKAEEARNTAVLSQLQALLGADSKPDQASGSPFAFLSSTRPISKGSNEQPLNQDVQYALSQLPALRQHLAQLKDSLQILPNARNRRDDEESDGAKRRQYLDTQTRRALQRKGVEADGSGSMRTGRKIGREEVEGIEAVVQALGGAETMRRPNDAMDE